MAIPESANYALDAFIARHGLRGGAAILGISHQRLSWMRQHGKRVPLEVVPMLVIGANDPNVTFASVRPDFTGFHLAAAIGKRRPGARFFGDVQDGNLEAWVAVASGKHVPWPKWNGDTEPDADTEQDDDDA
jgi:hypothetical protein